jgi:hypothetical protein
VKINTEKSAQSANISENQHKSAQISAWLSMISAQWCGVSNESPEEDLYKCLNCL